jgi:integrase
MMYLTDDAIRQLPKPAKGSKVYFDQANPDVPETADVVIPGMGARVTAAGFRAFTFDYRLKDGSGRQRRVTLGRFPYLSVASARSKARKLREIIESGKDPQAEKDRKRAEEDARRKAPDVAALAERFIAEHLPKRSWHTQDGYARIIRNHILPEIGTMKVSEVTVADAKAVHTKLTKAGKTYQANRTAVVMSKMFVLAEEWGMRPEGSNPARKIEHNKEYARRRYLSSEELGKLVTTLETHPDTRSANAIRMLLLTGARRGEVLGMKWSDLVFGRKPEWRRRAPDMKGREDSWVPLSPPAAQLLLRIRDQQDAAGTRGEFVFASTESRSRHIVDIRKLWRQVIRSAGIEKVRIHDLRHSFASQLVSAGASLPLIGSLLAHSSVSSTARYAHLADDAQREAVTRVGALFIAATKAEPAGMEPAKTNVAPLPRKIGA